jgi:hypothetical protein
MRRQRGGGGAVGLGVGLGLAWLVAVAGRAGAQIPDAAPAPAPAAAAPGIDLGRRYRFAEKFVVADAPKRPDEVVQHLVAFRETLSTLTDNPGAAAKAVETVIQARYAERVAALSPLDGREVKAVVRQYQAVRFTPEPPPAAGGANRPFEGLLLWYERRPGERPLVLSLTPGRTLSDTEYYLSSQHLFAPALVGALPELPVRKGDTYRVPRAGAEALLGQAVSEGVLTGTFQDILPAAGAGNPRPVAVFDVSGEVKVQTDFGAIPVGLHAQLRFAFEPPAGPAVEATVDAPGHITRLAMAQEMSVPIDPSRRLLQSMRREFVLDRRTDPAAVGAPLAVPDPAPTPTPENSWLTYADPKGRFRVRHPQDFRPSPGADADTLQLVAMRREGPNLIMIRLQPNAELEPEAIRKGRFASWTADGINPVAGEAGPLPEADWPGRRVYHFDARLVPPTGNGAPAGGAAAGAGAGDGSIMFDGYVVRTGRDTGLYAEATTPGQGEAHDAFRRSVETILQNFTFAGATAPAPAGGAPPPLPLPLPLPLPPRP